MGAGTGEVVTEFDSFTAETLTTAFSAHAHEN